MRFTHIRNWWEKKLTCANCRGSKSVKYKMNGKHYCNVCILPVSLGIKISPRGSVE